VKCHATENTYSKNSLVIPKKFSIYRSCIKSSIGIEVLKYNIKLANFVFGQNITNVALVIADPLSKKNLGRGSPFNVCYQHCCKKT
jgi:hypothetical protein